MTKVLWVVQVLLALLFMFAGGMKLVRPVEQMTRQAPVSLPVPSAGSSASRSARGTRPGPAGAPAHPARPDPLAAAGPVIIMIGATVVTLVGGNVLLALPPFVVGLLGAFVAYGR
jgi:hypothetical protein